MYFQCQAPSQTVSTIISSAWYVGTNQVVSTMVFWLVKDARYELRPLIKDSNALSNVMLHLIG